MKTMTKLLAIAPLVLASAAVTAAPGYNYMDFGYVNADRSGQSARTGYGLGGVFSFSERIHYAIAHANVDNSARETKATWLAIGFNTPISDNADFIARVGWAWETNRTGVNPSRKEDGLAASIGIRTWFTDEFELTGMLNYHNTFRSRGSLGAEGVYYFTDQLGIVGGVEFGNRARVARIGMRFSFDGF